MGISTSLKTLAGFAVLGSAGLAALFFVPHKTTFLSPEAKAPEDEYALLYTLAQNSMREELRPEKIELRPARKGAQGEEYVGSWKKESMEFFALYVKDNPTGAPSYLRIWALLPGEITDASVTEAAGRIFEMDHARLTCREAEDPLSGEKYDECGTLNSFEDGSRIGTIMRSPVILPSGQAATMIGACLVPKEFAAYYSYPSCL